MPGKIRILLALDGSVFSDAATDFALEIASRRECDLHGLCVIDAPGIRRRETPVQLLASYASKEAAETDIDLKRVSAVGIINRFRQKCQAKSVTATDEVQETVPFKSFVETMKSFDVLVIGIRTFFESTATNDHPGDTLSEILERTEKPVICVPERFRPVKNVLVAYDGSSGADAALSWFVRLALFDGISAEVLYIGDLDAGPAIVSKAAKMLGARGIANVQRIASGRPMRELRMASKDKDLVVLGAYGKNAISKFFFGSCADAMIEHGTVPLFLDHVE
ncbi:MAG: universal stress protein [Planctomycetes bacterium]|nr:universal stress protein [Planctomycetota bacterium]